MSKAPRNAALHALRELLAVYYHVDQDPPAIPVSDWRQRLSASANEALAAVRALDPDFLKCPHDSSPK